MSQWLRLYTETLSDPKVQKLPGDVFKAWINLLCVAKITEKNGVLPENVEDISFMLHISIAKTKQYISILSECGLIDDGAIHAWMERQYVSDSDPTNYVRQKRYRERHSNDNNALRNGKVTAIEQNRTEQNRTDSEIVKKDEVKTHPQYSQDFLTFYDSYPRKEGKTAALKTYTAKIKQGAGRIADARGVN